MKLFIITLAIIINLISTNLLAAEQCDMVFVSPKSMSKLARSYVDLANKKNYLINRIAEFLQIPLTKDTDWRFYYLQGKSFFGKTLNLQVENLTHVLFELTPEQLNIQAEEAVLNKNPYLNPFTGSGRLSIAIKGADYHHSLILGNHSTEYADFYLRVSNQTEIVSYKEVGNVLDVVIKENYTDDNGKDYTYFQRLVIDRSSPEQSSIIITEWSSSLISIKKTKRFYFNNNLNWTPKPKVENQSFGL